MYGKFFKSAFSGSMMAAGPEVFAVWGYVIAHAVDSRVELNPMLLAAVIGSTPDRMQAAIDKLCAPDPDSRSPECDGRRMVKEGQFQYFIVNHAKYRSIRNEDERREYNRIKKQEERARKADVKVSVIDSQRKSSVSAHTEAEAEADTKKKELPARRVALDPAAPAFDGRNGEALNGKAVVAIAVEWELPESWGVDAEALGWKPAEVVREAERFRQYWTAGRGAGTRRSVKGWRQSWSNWLAKAAERQR